MWGILVMPAIAKAAETPGEGLHFGASGYWIQPFGSGLVSGNRLKGGSGWSLDLSYQRQHFFIGAELLIARFGNDDTYSNPVFLGARSGYIFGSNNIAPYVALGLGFMGYGGAFDGGSGLGFSSEVGVLLFRSWRLKPSIVAQVNFPAFSLPRGNGQGASLPWSAVGIRLQL